MHNPPITNDPALKISYYMKHVVRSDWSEYNLNFDELSKRLLVVSREFGMRKAISTKSLTGETRTFAEILDKEVEKIVLFYLTTQGDLATKLWRMRERAFHDLRGCPLTLQEIDNACEKYRDLCQDVLDLLVYLEVNVIALRKILRKHDKQFDLKMSDLYFDSRLSTKKHNSQLLQLYHQEGLRAIIATIRRGFEELHEARVALVGLDSEDVDYFPGPSGGVGLTPIRRNSLLPRVPYKTRVMSFSSQFLSGAVNDELVSSPRKSFPHRTKSSNSLSSNLPRTFSASSVLPPETFRVSDYEPLLAKVNKVADRVLATQEQTTSDYIAQHSTMALYMRRTEEEESEEDFDMMISKKSLKATSVVSLCLTHLVTFLYQCNQYVVAPTAGQYADMLGLTPSMNGIIIGIAPFAALGSALVFSAWSNRSFKQPLLVCLLLLTLGNLLYAMALQCHSPALLFVGRLVAGLGGPRGITRRYIADHVSYEDRTQASTDFVTAGALGLAFGPLVSSIVDALDISFTWKVGVIVLVQYEDVTAPGWIMVTLFGTTFFAILLFFTEPTKVEKENNEPTSQAAARSPSKKSDRGDKWGEYNVIVAVEPLDINGWDEDPESSSKSVEIPASSHSKPSPHASAVPSSDHSAISKGLELVLPKGEQAPSETSSLLHSTPRSNGYYAQNNRHPFESQSELYMEDGNDDNSTKDSLSDKSQEMSVLQHSFRKHSRNLVGLSPLKFGSSVPTGPRLDFGLLSGASRNGCWEYITVEIYVIMFVYLVNKIGQEVVVTAAPTLCIEFLGWNVKSTGIFMACMGLLVLPTNVIVGFATKNVEDRIVMSYFTYFALGSIIVIINTNVIPYSVIQYLVGSLFLFSFLNSLEGVIMSILSKVVSPELARGTFNSGLLATEAGTLGRVIGDSMITAFSVMGGAMALSNLIFSFLGVGLILCVIVGHIYYDKLAV